MSRQTIFGLVLFLSLFTVLAASLAGDWDFTAKSSYGDTYYLTLSLQESEGKLSGTLGNEEGSIPLDNIRLEENRLSFEVTTPEGTTYAARLTVKEDQMSGTYSGDDGSSGSIEAKRSER